MEKNIVMTIPETPCEIQKVTLTLANGADVTVQVLKTLTIEEKIVLVEDIVNECVSNKFNYFNPLLLEILARVKTIEAYTDIVCDTKELYKFYDILKANGVFDKILPLTEYNEILGLSFDCADSLCNYKNSFAGILQTMQAENATNDILKQFQEAIEAIKDDDEVKDFMKEVAPHLV